MLKIVDLDFANFCVGEEATIRVYVESCVSAGDLGDFSIYTVSDTFSSIELYDTSSLLDANTSCGRYMEFVVCAEFDDEYYWVIKDTTHFI